YVVNKRANKVDLLIKNSQIDFSSNYSKYRGFVNIKKVALKKNGQFTGEVKIDNGNYDFSGKINITQNSVYINIKSNFIKLLFVGDRNREKLQGKLVLLISNHSDFMDALAKVINLSFLTYVIPSESIKVLSNINLNDSEFTATDLKIDSKSMKASGVIQNNRKNNHINVSINFSKVNLDFIQDNSQRTVSIKDLLECFRKTVPKNLDLDLNIEASNIQYQNRTLDKFYAMLKFIDGEIEIDAFLQFFGTNNVAHLLGKVVSRSNFVLSEFDGDLLVKGDNFKLFVSCFFPFVKIRGNERSQFTINSRLHFAPRILSILDIKLLNDREFLQGSVKIRYTKKHNVIDGIFNVHNFNIDKYNCLLVSDLLKVQWLKNLKYNVNIKVNVNDFMLNNTKIENLGFLLKIENSKFVTSRMKLSGKNFNVIGDIKMSVDQAYVKPLLDISFSGNKFDGGILKLPNLLEVKRDSKNRINKIQWSTEQFNYLKSKENFDANVRINITEFKTGQDVLKDFNLDAVIINNTLIIKEVNYALKYGKVSFQGYLRSGSMYMKFFIIGLDTQRVGQVMEIYNLSGRMNLSGEIRAQGKSFHDWANTLSGDVNLQTQGVKFTNVDFNSFIINLFSSKNKSGISTLTHVGIYNGSTFFGNMIGKIGIKNGICSISIQFEIDQASGSISSNLNLSNFTLISLLRFFFIPPGRSPVYIDIHLDGPIWYPRMSFDEDLIFNTIVGEKY
ncbi:MAG: AsmA-like C-terminal region-containing protein, partial [Wolbachia pipientis]|nr:AsmA-like C-terminal region-containing protein [Wolbachia pipientis]